MANWSNNAKRLLEKQYLRKNDIGEVCETPDQMLLRVARCASGCEEDEDFWMHEFLSIMDSLEFLPNTPTLMNALTPLGQLAGCFVLPIEDDLSAIFEAVKQSALIHKSGGGTGFSFSNLRAANSMVKSSGGVASGPVSFIRCFDVVTETVKQGGRRRGANLGCMRDSHPDIFEFVNCKSDGKSLPNFNISVCVTDKFMKSVYAGDEHWLRDRSDNGNRRLIDATDLFDEICMNMWKTGEPGIIFIDKINSFNPTPWLGTIEATNPCVIGSTKIETSGGQVPISDLVDKKIKVLCCDGSKIRYSWMRNIRKTGEKESVWKVCLDNGENVVATGDHKFMLVDGSYKCLSSLVNGDSLMSFCGEEISSVSVKSIKFYGYEDVYDGIVMGVHNYALSAGAIIHNCGEQPLLPYESCNLGSIDISKFISDDRHINYIRLSHVIHTAVRFLDNILEVNIFPRAKIRNKTRLTRKIGLGVMGWATALHKMGYKYDSEDAVGMAEVVMEFIKSESYNCSIKLGEEKGVFPATRGYVQMRNACVNTIAPTGSLSLLAGCSSSIEPIFARTYEKTLHDGDKMQFDFDRNMPISTEISPEWHIRMQAAFQKYTDNAVSKTINLPNEATIDDVRNAVSLAYESGCKGITMYRQGTREAPLKNLECESERCKT